MTARVRRAREKGTVPGVQAGLSRWHVHRYRWAGTDAFSNAGLYACRCGVVRPGL